MAAEVRAKRIMKQLLGLRVEGAQAQRAWARAVGPWEEARSGHARLNGWPRHLFTLHRSLEISCCRLLREYLLRIGKIADSSRTPVSLIMLRGIRIAVWAGIIGCLVGITSGGIPSCQAVSDAKPQSRQLVMPSPLSFFLPEA